MDILTSTNYEQFSFMGANRGILDGHVTAIKKAFEKTGNFTEQQPILVNENFEIIDGQHRFTACKELGLPIHYTIRPGLRVYDARQMNILQRKWSIVDYARSNAADGNPNYIAYLQLLEEYPFTNSVLLMYVKGTETKGFLREFKDGDFVLNNIQEVRQRLDNYTEAVEVIGSNNGYLARAYLMLMRSPDFNQKRMIQKLKEVGTSIVRNFGSTQDYMRALEEVFNHKLEERNRVRLY